MVGSLLFLLLSFFFFPVVLSMTNADRFIFSSKGRDKRNGGWRQSRGWFGGSEHGDVMPGTDHLADPHALRDAVAELGLCGQGVGFLLLYALAVLVNAKGHGFAHFFLTNLLSSF